MSRIARVRVARERPAFAAELEASESLVSSPEQTTSWIMAWCRAVDASTMLIVGEDETGAPVLVLPLERAHMARLPIWRTITFRQGPFGPVRSARPVAELIDDDARSLIAEALWRSGARAPLLALFDVRGDRPDAASPLHVVQQKYVAWGPVPDSDQPGRDFFGSKQATELRRRRRRLSEKLGDEPAYELARDAGVLSRELRRMLQRKRIESQQRETGSQLDSPHLARFLDMLVDEADARGDLDVLLGCLGGEGSASIADVFCVSQGSDAHGLIQVFDPTYGRYSPGRLALLGMVEALAERSITRLNFGKTETPELPPFANEVETIHDLALPLHAAFDPVLGPAHRVAASVRRRVLARTTRQETS